MIQSVNSTSPGAETAGSTVVTPSPAAAHPSTAQIRWSWRYQLWPVTIVLGLVGLVVVLGVVSVLVHGPHAAGDTYVTRAGTTRTYDGSWLDSFTPLLGPAIAVLVFAPMIWYVTPRRRIRRFLRHHPWTRWDATVEPKPMVDGRPDPKALLITLHGTDGRDHRLYADSIYQREQYGWTTGRQPLFFAGRPDVRGVVVRTLGDTPSMAYQVPPTREERQQQLRARSGGDRAR